MIKKVCWVREISVITEATDIRDMGLHRRRVKISSHQYFEARLLKAETQTSGAAEQIKGRKAAGSLSSDPPTNRRLVVWIGSIGVGEKLKPGSSIRFDRRAGALLWLGLGSGRRAHVRTLGLGFRIVILPPDGHGRPVASSPSA